ncbi:MAG: GNAT family N-acetyltransferase, partial [Verrucomicrobia bacterium]|nr:GNAT family N-acetyltransferase [Verrucomicrobiota bacterium]
MNIRVIHPEELTPSQIQLWTEMMTPSDATDSPFFHPDYVITLGRFRESVRVAIVTENDRVVAFFPLEQHGKTGRPLGIKLCDFQGIVRAPGITLDARELLAGCGLTTWHFDHVVASQPEFNPWCLRVEDSPYADLSNGFDAYVAERKRAGNRSIAETLRKRRKFEREVGPLRFAWQSSDPAAFEALLEWKSAQRKQTETFDVLQLEWVVKTLDALRNMHSENFGGVLSTLHVNDTLAAVSLCMRTQTVLHHWFPAYNTELSAYSPGLILHVAVLQAAAERGICRFDFGKGKDRYKDSFTSGS